MFKALAILLYDESTGAAQKAIKACKQLIATAATTSTLNGAKTTNFQECCLNQFADDIRTNFLMPGISDLKNTIVMVRFFELSVQLSLLS